MMRAAENQLAMTSPHPEISSRAAKLVFCVLAYLLCVLPARVFSSPRVVDTIHLSQDASVDHPVPIAVDPQDGSIFVAGYYSGNVLKVNPTTKKSLAQATGINFPDLMEFVDGKLYVAGMDGSFQARIFIYDRDLNLVDSILSSNGLIHCFRIDNVSQVLYYGTWGRLYSVRLGDLGQTLLHDFANGAYSVSNIDIDRDRNRLYITGYNVSSALAEVVNFDLGTGDIDATIPIGKNPVYYDNRYDSDRDGDYLFVTQMYSSSITVVDIAKNERVMDIPDVSWPQRLTLDKARHRLYVIDNYSDKFHILDTVNLKLVKSFTPGDDPSGVVIDKPRNRIYTANVWTQDIGVIDAIGEKLLERISLAAATPLDVRVDSGEGIVYVSNGPNGGIYRIESASGKVLDRINFYSYSNVQGLFDFPSGLLNIFAGEMALEERDGQTDRMAYVVDEFNQGIGVLNLTSRRFERHITPDGSPSSVVMHGNDILFTYVADSKLYLGISDGTNVTPYLLGASDKSQGIAVHAAKQKCYVADYANHKVIVFDLAAKKVLKSLDVGEYPSYIGIDTESGKVYVSNYGSNSVSVIDSSNDTVVNTIDVGSAPWGVEANPGSRRVYVVNSGDSSLSVIDSRKDEVVATLPVGNNPRFCGVDPKEGRIYVASQSSGTVTVIEDGVDVKPPVIQCLAPIEVKNVETDEVKVNFDMPTVTDNADPNPVVTVDPASGSFFPVGETAVTVTAKDASGNVSTCKFTITIREKVCPIPVDDLAAKPLPTRRIELSWSLSETPGLEKYEVFMGVASIDFSNPVATLATDRAGWTAENLQSGVTYKFVVRAVHASGCADQNLNIVSATAYDTPPCLSASIKTPQNGKKISGQGLTVLALTRCADLEGVRSVRFEYRSASPGNSAWTKILAANENHPNPDKKSPYFVHWNVNQLAVGEYQIRAVALDENGTADSSPSFVTVKVDHDDPDSEEIVDDDGKVKKIEKVKNHKTNIVIVTDKSFKRSAEIKIPKGALNQAETKVTVRLNPDETPEDTGRFKAAGASIEIKLESGQSQLGVDATLTLPYFDENDDGIVDGTDVDEDDLAVYYYNPSLKKWKIMAGSRVDKKNKTVSVNTSHFSLFGVFGDPTAGVDGTFRFGEVYAYPNPYRRGPNPIIHVEPGQSDGLEVRIYDLSGELINTLTVNAGPAVIGGRFAYEVVWDVTDVASGIYVAVVRAKQKDQNDLKKMIKIAVVK